MKGKGKARRGKARRGKAGRGKARQGEEDDDANVTRVRYVLSYTLAGRPSVRVQPGARYARLVQAHVGRLGWLGTNVGERQLFGDRGRACFAHHARWLICRSWARDARCCGRGGAPHHLMLNKITVAFSIKPHCLIQGGNEHDMLMRSPHGLAARGGGTDTARAETILAAHRDGQQGVR